jgi:hypothetical protein
LDKTFTGALFHGPAFSSQHSAVSIQPKQELFYRKGRKGREEDRNQPQRPLRNTKESNQIHRRVEGKSRGGNPMGPKAVRKLDKKARF